MKAGQPEQREGATRETGAMLSTMRAQRAREGAEGAG